MGSGNKIVGVTGVVGSGKSTLCNFLQEQCGFVWINADDVVHELYKVGRPGYQKIKEYFGTYFVGKYKVSRAKLRRTVLKNPQKLWILNQLIHPLVLHEVNKKIVQIKRLNISQNVCVEAVYFEAADLHKFIDQLVIIDVHDEKIIHRLKERKIPLDELKILIKFQRRNFPLNAGEKIENNGTKEEFYAAIRRFLC